ncbi:hypothetical protein CDV36_011978 [Fusarium kuroshium]|uniref:NB-ARC domain-containing protein n=1 Tax=Fusarium kuroshium TaxID=2010991 RepID=A0A3M2RSU5_9HYPO|nr:hypothetical protein CDV36_011978 [Fusarium kuroshium]
MDTRELEQFFQTEWLSTVKECQEKIKDREDKRTVRSFRNYDDIVEHLINDLHEPLSEVVLRDLSMIRPRLIELRDFSDDFGRELGPRLDPSPFWGLMGLMVIAAAQMQEQGATHRVVQMLKKLSRDVEILRGYCSNDEPRSNKLKEAIFEIFVISTKLFADVAELLRDDDHFMRCNLAGQDVWKPLKNMIKVATRDIEESLKAMERTVTLSSNKAWLYSLMSPSPRTWKDDATLPCVMLPPARNAKFFNRDEVINRIEKHFNQPSCQAFRSLTLYGMAGVGKTHVAMKYAQTLSAAQKVSAVLWVEGETEMKVKQSFTDIARRLQLPNYVPHSHDDNRLLVLTWLQQTNASWLIVYDNVDSFEVLHSHWPNSAAKGHALITTRNTTLAYEPAETGIEVSAWDKETGSHFLLHLLSGHISADMLANEAKSALELSERLSGHALALARMGGVIHRRCWTIQELVEVYDRQPEFKHGIGPVWQISFENLNTYSSSLLSIFALCSADKIPQGLLEPEMPESLPKGLEWFADRENGYHQQGVDCLKRSLNIRVQEENGDEMEVSWAEHNLGEAYVTMGELDTAHYWFKRAAETWKRWAMTEPRGDKPEASPFQQMSMATCLLYMGNIQEARRALEPPLGDYLKTATENWTNAA